MELKTAMELTNEIMNTLLFYGNYDDEELIQQTCIVMRDCIEGNFLALEDLIFFAMPEDDDGSPEYVSFLEVLNHIRFASSDESPVEEHF